MLPTAEMRSGRERRPLVKKRPGLELVLPGKKPVRLSTLVCDFTGTLSLDGKLLPGVAVRLRRLARRVSVIVATADTFGTAKNALARLPIDVRMVQTGHDKVRLVDGLGADHVVAIGNGRNDIGMIRKVALGIAVVGPEGAAGVLLREADVVVHDIRCALDLLLRPLRLKATLRR